MKTTITPIAAAVALLAAAASVSAITLFNPDYVVTINHEFETSVSSNFGGAFGSWGGVDSGAFQNEPTLPRQISCVTGADGICRMPSGLILGNRWPGEVYYATDSVQGYQYGSFAIISHGANSNLFSEAPPTTPQPDPQACVAKTCDPARTTQQDANTIAYADAKGKWTSGKWLAAASAGFIAALIPSPKRELTAGIASGAAYVLTKEAGEDALSGLAQAQATAVVLAYNKCKTACGA